MSLAAGRAGRLVLVWSTQTPPPVGVIQQWTADEWTDLLNAIKYAGERGEPRHVAIDDAGGMIVFGLHRHEKLLVADGPWDAFAAAVRAGEFEHATMRTYASTLSSPAPSTGGYDAGEVGSAGGRSDQVVTGAVEVAGASPGTAPVAAHHHTAGWGGVPGQCGVECACGTTFDNFDTIAEAAALLDDHIAAANLPTSAPVAAQPPKSGPGLVPAERVGEHLWERIGRLASCQRCGVIEGYDGAAEPCRGRVLVELRELMEPAVPVAATPRYILDRDAVMELVERYGDARVCEVSAMEHAGYDEERQFAKQAAELIDAIRAALTPVPAVEPEPAWGSGPLVEHNPETRPSDAGGEVTANGGCSVVTDGGADPVPETPGAGSADPKPLALDAGICRCGADGHGPGDNWCVCRPGTGSADPDTHAADVTRHPLGCGCTSCEDIRQSVRGTGSADPDGGQR